MARISRIHVFNNALIFVDHILALDFHGWGNLAAGNRKLVRHLGESANLFMPGKVI